MKKKHYILIAVVAYFFLLIATIPAKPVIDQINTHTSLNIQGVSGTLWQGKAYLVTVNNDTTLKNSSWSVSSWKLLIGQLAADVETHLLGNDIKSEIGATLLGSYFINQLNARIDAKDVAQLAAIPLAQLSGPMSIDIEHASWSKGELPSATGVIDWNNAEVTVADTVSLGKVTITMIEADQLYADIKNQGGDISIAGNARLEPEANYAVDITLTPTAATNNNIKQSLVMFAKQQPGGIYLFKNSGSLKQIGLM